jgi:hypothetical protein
MDDVDDLAARNGEWLCVHACVWPLPVENVPVTVTA